jgi:L,D-transpeptidase catalytic domain
LKLILNLLMAALLAGALAFPALADSAASDKCHWWQFRCEETIDGLPADAPRTGTVITIDLSTNTAYLFNDGQLVRRSACARGSEKILENGDDMWLFRTPRGHLKVLRKIIDPVWRKPDWAFIEAREKIPPPDSPARLVHGKLGKYALDLGEGILIHGTDDASSIGRNVSHGCVRLPNAMLAVVFKAAKVGTDVFIFESSPQATVERHSDLEFATATSPLSSRVPDRGDPGPGSTQSRIPQRRQQ